MSLHVIFGTGPVGQWTARALRERGEPVRMVNRSGRRPSLLPDDVELIQADVTDPSQARVAAVGASTVYQAMSPPYHQWAEAFPALQTGAIAAARWANARYVSIENLYMFDATTTITESSRIAPVSRKGELRQRMADEVMRLHAHGDLYATALRSSDYYGPGVVGSALGALVFGNLVAGKTPQIGGREDQPHSFAYIEDVGRAAAVLGTEDAALGRAWIAPHAPAVTQGEMVRIACRALNVPERVGVISPLMMRVGGLFIPEARATVEMLYEFVEPFVVDSSRIEEVFGLAPTPLEAGIDATVAWFRDHTMQPA
jgi:nucleoside-diphosphate-sugar epimerase